MNPVKIEDFTVGDRRRPLLIAGPCVLQNLPLCRQIAETLVLISEKHSVKLVFKASFDKANRSSGDSYRGPGLEPGLGMLDQIRREFRVPVVTDIHLPEHALVAAEVCEVLQIPAFLARQTDLLIAAAETGKALNIKKGQFMAPTEMKNVVEKVYAVGNKRVMLCERGTFFGYGRLVNDMTSLPIMRSFGAPVIFDATHSVQHPAGLGTATGGNRAMVEPLARAAAAVGVDGFFFEVHPDPDSSPSDGPNMIQLNEFERLFSRVLRIWETAVDDGA